MEISLRSWNLDIYTLHDCCLAFPSWCVQGSTCKMDTPPLRRCKHDSCENTTSFQVKGFVLSGWQSELIQSLPVETDQKTLNSETAQTGQTSPEESPVSAASTEKSILLFSVFWVSSVCHLDLKTESQSTGSAPAASAVLGMDGKKDCIFCLNSDSWRDEEMKISQKTTNCLFKWSKCDQFLVSDN